MRILKHFTPITCRLVVQFLIIVPFLILQVPISSLQKTLTDTVNTNQQQRCPLHHDLADCLKVCVESSVSRTLLLSYVAPSHCKSCFCMIHTDYCFTVTFSLVILYCRRNIIGRYNLSFARK